MIAEKLSSLIKTDASWWPIASEGPMDKDELKAIAKEYSKQEVYSTSTRAGEGAICRYLSRQGKIVEDIHETKYFPARVDVLYTPMVFFVRISNFPAVSGKVRYL